MPIPKNVRSKSYIVSYPSPEGTRDASRPSTMVTVPQSRIAVYEHSSRHEIPVPSSHWLQMDEEELPPAANPRDDHSIYSSQSLRTAPSEAVGTTKEWNDSRSGSFQDRVRSSTSSKSLRTSHHVERSASTTRRPKPVVPELDEDAVVQRPRLRDDQVTVEKSEKQILGTSETPFQMPYHYFVSCYNQYLKRAGIENLPGEIVQVMHGVVEPTKTGEEGGLVEQCFRQACAKAKLGAQDLSDQIGGGSGMVLSRQDAMPLAHALAKKTLEFATDKALTGMIGVFGTGAAAAVDLVKSHVAPWLSSVLTNAIDSKRVTEQNSILELEQHQRRLHRSDFEDIGEEINFKIRQLKPKYVKPYQRSNISTTVTQDDHLENPLGELDISETDPNKRPRVRSHFRDFEDPVESGTRSGRLFGSVTGSHGASAGSSRAHDDQEPSPPLRSTEDQYLEVEQRDMAAMMVNQKTLDRVARHDIYIQNDSTSGRSRPNTRRTRAGKQPIVRSSRPFVRKQD